MALKKQPQCVSRRKKSRRAKTKRGATNALTNQSLKRAAAAHFGRSISQQVSDDG
jgi:hypothetical protein